ncbi:MAG: LysR family transcriptional regulator [Desulfuromonadales bacterium]|nr:LysR family transcriptional regulator [Desulfuromonadales bacterium]
MKTFVTIAREKNLTRAAKILHLSQSALSSQLKQLEGELGITLFQRTARGMELTANGHALLPQVRSLLDDAHELRQRALAMKDQGGETVTIGLNSSPSFLQIRAINRRLTLLHPELNSIFLTSQSVNTEQMLRQGRIDLGFHYAGNFSPDVKTLVLAQARFCLVIPAHLVAEKIPEDWNAVAALPWVWVARNSPPYMELAERLSGMKLAVKQAVSTEDEYIVKELAEDGQGVALLREDEARPLVDAGRTVIWEKGWLSLPLGLAWLESRQREKKIRSAVEVVRYVWGGSATEDGDLSAGRYWF